MSYSWQPKPAMISRSGWNAASPSGCSGSNSKQYIIVHHSGDQNDALAIHFGTNEKGFMKRIQEIHMNSNRWCDIGYNFGIGVVGSILEGRNLNVLGAHAVGYNSNAIGICVHGNYDIRSFTLAQENSLVDLLAWLCYTYNISTANILGHRDVSSTACPGAGIYSKLSSIRSKVLQKLSPQSISVHVFNDDTGNFEVSNLALNSPMPYVLNSTLTVREFKGNSNSSVIWTHKRFIQAWNTLRSGWGRGIHVPIAFNRIWEGGHGYQDQHYAGVAIDCGQNLSNTEREQLRSLASSLGVFEYVEPASTAPTWVHIDKRLRPSACSAGYILVRNGSKNTCVFVLQDALNTLGYTGGGLDGAFGNGTETAVRNFQRAYNLTVDGIVGCQTWTMLTQLVRGMGKTPTTVNP
ncbi:peptidoglycan recognition protein family protein [Alkaliphilus peptidifermentans]|uniref:Putative peptidoglycan binding domain-containing protein n=1 Tax=Alkaliphilus peptidifermentans DSM 18978 TaxID=1120976 RepID=A0A1G5ISQ7_9FIRM|nr:N-acetylmuramoyl-L-alanine amidase [Alkaliphilus peptidifermentans]SCY79122.1 Putative peptidoglycan binding domain-containing protein [Alkaliphilus peptidifermentans DSM 18978]